MNAELSDTTPRIRVGIKLFGQARTVSDLREFWTIADDSGFDHCWVSDHLCSLGDDRSLAVFEAWTLLAAMAEVTKRVRIGCLVTANTFRHPGVLAKSAVTVDHLSGGRLEFGIGAAWDEQEHAMLGLRFAPASERVANLDEACRILKALWTEESPSFEGVAYHVQGGAASPKPVQKPHPPIWIGGVGERKTLRVVAEHADVWNAPGSSPTETGRLSGVLDDHCHTLGRDPREIRRSVQFRFDGDANATLDTARQYLAHGIDDWVLVAMGAADDGIRQAHQLAALLPDLRSLQ